MTEQCFMNMSGKLSEEYYTSRNFIFALLKYPCRKCIPPHLRLSSTIFRKHSHSAKNTRLLESNNSQITVLSPHKKILFIILLLLLQFSGAYLLTVLYQLTYFDEKRTAGLSLHV